jgi:hypothetical protein
MLREALLFRGAVEHTIWEEVVQYSTGSHTLLPTNTVTRPCYGGQKGRQGEGWGWGGGGPAPQKLPSWIAGLCTPGNRIGNTSGATEASIPPPHAGPPHHYTTLNADHSTAPAPLGCLGTRACAGNGGTCSPAAIYHGPPSLTCTPGWNPCPSTLRRVPPSREPCRGLTALILMAAARWQPVNTPKRTAIACRE